jgi:uncharacterized protein YyaL (SSP411 family)
MAALARIRHRLFEARSTRPRPHLDDKILTAWNGLMIAACARAARVLEGRPTAREYLDSARRAAMFIRQRLWTEAGLLRRFRDGEAAISAYAEDYAYLVWGLLELFQAGGGAQWLDWALALQRQQDDKFWDPGEGGWFSTTGEDPSVLLRLKEDYDGAEPAASSVAALNALKLAHLTGDSAMREKVERTLGRYGPRIGSAGRQIPMMMCVLSAWHAGCSQVVIVGSEAAALKQELARRHLPFAIVVPIAPGQDQEAVGRLLPFTAAMTTRGAGAAAYVCHDFTCREPVKTADALAAQLEPVTA